jgi:Fe-S cluster assembly iron-binding protein IscA
MIEITDATRDKIKEVLARNPSKYLRIVVEGTGCGGPYLSFSLDEANSFEETVRVNGIDMLISEDVKKYAEATTVNIFLNRTEG